MEVVKVIYDYGKDYVVTRINGTREEIADYYKIGTVVNIGAVSDVMREITAVEFLETVE